MRQRNPSSGTYLSEGQWIPHRLELLTSPAWRHRPRPLAKILERLEIEHLFHAGKENGELIVTYDQFVAFGISRRAVYPSLAIGQQLGLIAVSHDEKWGGEIRPPNRYRLTYVPAKGKKAPTDEWKYLSLERVQASISKAGEDAMPLHREVA